MDSKISNNSSALAIILIVALFFIIACAGYAVATNSGTNVVWFSYKSNITNLTESQISIVSSEKALTVQANFSEDNCSLIDYSILPEPDIYAYKDSEKIWIVGNDSDILNAEIDFSIPIECNVTSIHIVGVSNVSLDSPSPGYGSSSSSSSGRSSNGGGVGIVSRSGSNKIKNNVSQGTLGQITQAKNATDYNRIKKGTESSLLKNSRVDWTFFIWIIALSFGAGLIIIFLLISFIRSPAK